MSNTTSATKHVDRLFYGYMVFAVAVSVVLVLWGAHQLFVGRGYPGWYGVVGVIAIPFVLYGLGTVAIWVRSR